MHLFLHIGCEKTGTTAIQRFMQMNRELLEARGVLFPRTAGREGHVGLAVAAEADEKRDELRLAFRVGTPGQLDRFRRGLLAALRREIGASRAEKAILSNEHCSSRLTSVGEIERLEQMLRSLFADITVVMYLRRQDELLVSHYSSYVRSGGTKEIALKDEQDRRSYYDHWPMIANWMSVFGRANIVVRRYHRRWLIAGDAVDDFCAVVGIDPPSADSGFERPPRQNESLDANACAFLRLFNGLVPCVIAGQGKNPARGGIDALLLQVCRGPVQSLEPTALAAFMASFRASNGRVAEEFFGGVLDGPDDPLFGGPDSGRPRTLEPDLTLEKAIGIFARLWEGKQGELVRLLLEARALGHGGGERSVGT